MTDKSRVQGEGDKQADRQYRQKTRDFVESGKVDEAARKARDIDPEEAERAENEGKARARELDPQVHRDPDKAVKDDS